jgi:predicted transcriptional regulator
LIPPCEIAVKSVIPAIKALVARELVVKHGMRQGDVAEILGISQSAVSKYMRRVRGNIIRVDSIGEIKPVVSKIMELLVGEGYQRGELLALFCETCAIIRRNSLMCQFCRKGDAADKLDGCTFCLDHNSNADEK